MQIQNLKAKTKNYSIKSKSFNLLTIFLAFLFFVLTFAPGITVSAYNSSSAIQYLKSQSLTDWSVMALAASRQLHGADLNFLDSDPGTIPTDIEKRILARAAAGKNADNLAARLVDQFDGQQISNARAGGLLSDDIFGALALSATSARPDIVSRLADFIRQHQSASGGWSHFPNGNPNTDFTAMAAMALLASGESPNSQAIERAFQFLDETSTGAGFSHFPGSGADPYSTAWAISAYSAADRGIPAGAASYLSGFQRPNGSFGDDPALTSYAVIALAGGFYPASPAPASNPEAAVLNQQSAPNQNESAESAVTLAIYGPGQELIFENTVNEVSTALDTVTRTGIDHTLLNTPFGTYVKSIYGISESGQSGWMYAVGGVKPNVTAANFAVSPGDRVVWFFGEPNDQPPGQDQNSAAVSLTANIEIPVPENPAAEAVMNSEPVIIFGVDTSAVDFGTLRPGDTSDTRQITLINDSNVPVSVETSLENADSLYERGLFIDRARWQSYRPEMDSRSRWSADLTLEVPADYQETGQKNATLIFWAKTK